MLETGLRQLARFPVTGDNTVELLQQAVEAAGGMPGVTGAGLMLVDAEGQLRHAAAADDAGERRQREPEELGSGPCQSAFRRDDLVSTPDVRAGGWPEPGRRGSTGC